MTQVVNKLNKNTEISKSSLLVIKIKMSRMHVMLLTLAFTYLQINILMADIIQYIILQCPVLVHMSLQKTKSVGNMIPSLYTES